jgi:hypothetical protein
LSSNPPDGIQASAEPEFSPAVFPARDIRWAMEWARVAPGWGGWVIRTSVLENGDEAICVAPPGSIVERFVICAGTFEGRQHVEIYWAEEHEDGGRLSQIGHSGNLRDALLFLCPLSEAQMSRLKRALADRLSSAVLYAP